MKRSEVLSIIWESINEVEDAEHLLTRLEKIGMLPPATEWLVENHPEQMHWSEVHDYHMWEPEDDDIDHLTEKNWRERYGKYDEEE